MAGVGLLGGGTTRPVVQARYSADEKKVTYVNYTIRPKSDLVFQVPARFISSVPFQIRPSMSDLAPVFAA